MLKRAARPLVAPCNFSPPPPHQKCRIDGVQRLRFVVELDLRRRRRRRGVAAAPTLAFHAARCRIVAGKFAA